MKKAKANILILTNNLTSGAIPHQIIDLAPVLEPEFNLYAGALAGGGDDRTDKEVLQELQDAGVEPVRFNFDTNPTYKEFLKLYSFLEDIDIVHTHLVKSGIIGRVVARARRVSGVVSTEQMQHNLNHHGLKRRVIYGITLPLADCVVAISEQVQSSYESWENMLLKTTNQEIIHNTVDPTGINKYSEEPLSGDINEFLNSSNIIIGSVGRLVQEKNHSILINLLVQLRDRYPERFANVSLIMVGDGELRPQYEDQIRANNLSDSVFITGWVDRKKVYSIMYNLDVFVMPSLSEGLGVSLIEAMYASKPIVASDIPVFHEVLGSAALFANNDPDDWAEQITKFLTDKDLRNKKGKLANRMASETFDPKVVGSQYAEIYQSLLNQKEHLEQSEY